MEGAISSPATATATANTRVAVVTGGNKGIGLEVCRQLAGNGGVTVVLTARDEARGAAAVEKLREQGLSDVIFHQLEITDASSIARLAEFLKTRFGRLDILVNNAAIGGIEYVHGTDYSSVTSKEKEETAQCHGYGSEVWVAVGKLPGDLRHCKERYADKLLRHKASGRSPSSSAASLIGWKDRQCLLSLRTAGSNSSKGLHMDFYSKIWKFGVKIQLQQSL